MPLLRPACLVLCPRCGRHAHIALSDGTKTDEFGNKADIVATALALLDKEKLVAEEAAYVADQLAEARLPRDQVEMMNRSVLEAAAERATVAESLHEEPVADKPPTMH